MYKKLAVLICLIINWTVSAQDFSLLWEGYFSYYNIIDVTQSNNKIFAASENAIFSYDINTNEIETISTIEGLSGESITTIVYSESYETLLIGYETGLIELVLSNGDIVSVVDILDKETISPVLKRINHFNLNGEYVYISTDYGISVYDLERLEFGDTYFIGNGGSQIKINQTAVFEGFIYAACSNNNGLKKSDLTNPNLIDYLQWQQVVGGNYIAIQSVDLKLYTIRADKRIFEVINNSTNLLFTYVNTPLDVKTVNSNLIITTNSEVYVYDSDFNLLSDAVVNEDFDTNFTASSITSEHIYIGTTEFGVLKADFLNPIEYQQIVPEGPLMNSGYKIESGNNELWVSYGDYTLSYNPAPARSFGLSHYKEESWNNIPFDSLLAAVNLNYIAINPFNPNQVFVSSFRDGLLELNNDVATNLYDENNSGLQSIVIPNNPNFSQVRLTGLTFDRNGILWMMSSRVDRPVISYNPSTNQWQTYALDEFISNGLTDELGFSDIFVDVNGTKWIAAFNNGVIGFNENGGSNTMNNVSTLDQNIPALNIRALAIDNRNQLWIGTLKGLRVLYNTSNFLSDPNPSVSEIVIVDNGIPTELLANQFITDIKVDGSNNKWVGTLDSGLFYFSPDGQQTIYQFTRDNSPLPSNTINDIAIDTETGKVYIATQKGLVSFTTGGSKPEDALTNAYVYPNPVRPEYNVLGFNDLNDINKGVKIKGLTEKVNVKITDIEGNLVAEAQSGVNLRTSTANYNFAIDGGTAIWNGKNLANNIVASGVYLILISDLDSFETKVLKLLIIR